MISVEAVLALPGRQITVGLDLDEDVTVGVAVGRLAMLEEFASENLADYACGVFGEICDETRVLKEGDRLEFYRPLVVNAKERRRKIARGSASGRGTSRQPQAPRKGED